MEEEEQVKGEEEVVAHFVVYPKVLKEGGVSRGFVLSEEIQKSKVSSLPLPATKETKEMEEMKHEAKK